MKDFNEVLPVASTIIHYSMASSGPGEGCEVGNGNKFDAFIDIAVKKSSAQIFTSIAAYEPKKKPLGGVGDEAFDMGTQESNVPGATETNIYARKGAMTCNVSLIRHNGEPGDKAVIVAPRDELLIKLGALCNKVFAARS
jgi:hypothetical protein